MPPALDMHPTPPRSPQPDMYQAVLNALRGRYIWVVVLAIAGAAAGGYLGRKMGKILYRSEALIQIMRRPPIVDSVNEINKPIEDYDIYMRGLVMNAGSSRVVKMALDEPEWQATGLGDSPAMVDAFSHSLSIDHPDESEAIRVIYQAKTASVAAAGAQALAHAFMDDYRGEGKDEEEIRLQQMSSQETELAKRLTELTSSMAPPPTLEKGDPEQRYKDASALEADLASRLAKARLDLEFAKLMPGLPPESAAAIKMVAEKDPVLLGYQQTQWNASDRMRQLTNQGIGHSNFQYIQAQKDFEDATKAYTDYLKSLPGGASSPGTAAMQPERSGQPTVGGSTSMFEATVQALDKAHEDAVQDLVAAYAELSKVRVTDRSNEGIAKQADALRGQLEAVQTQRQSLVSEQVLADRRLKVVTMGDVPLNPDLDNRMKYSLAGAFMGTCLPVGLLILLGFVNRRYRYADEMTRDLDSRGGAALLGVLPVLPPDMKDFERSADAAQCMHQIRVLLQIGGRPGAKVFLVTSASPGEGKTSLTAALGLSFVASGARTLLMDCDMVGQALTRGLEVTGSRGLREAMAGESMESCVTVLRPGLAIMPVGGAKAVDACSISPQVMKPILAAARQNYDVVLIDSGPLLGSVEASVLAPQVDEVVVTISRGQQPLLVKRTFQHLKSLGATVAGCVFNRAGKKDFATSYPGSSLRSVNPDEVLVEPVRRPSRLGPLVESVDRFMPGAEANQKEG